MEAIGRGRGFFFENQYVPGNSANVTYFGMVSENVSLLKVKT